MSSIMGNNFQQHLGEMMNLTPATVTKDRLLRKEIGQPWYNQICEMLDNSDKWKNMMTNITKEGSPTCYMFTHQQVKQIEKHIPIKQLGGTEILLYEWGTMGQNQPTLGDLFNLLVRSELFRAADFLAEVLKIDRPPRPKTGPAAVVDVSELLAEENNCNKEIDIKCNVQKDVNKYQEYQKNKVDLNSSSNVSNSQNKEDDVRTEELSDLIKFNSNLSKGYDVMDSAELPLILQYAQSITSYNTSKTFKEPTFSENASDSTTVNSETKSNNKSFSTNQNQDISKVTKEVGHNLPNGWNAIDTSNLPLILQAENSTLKNTKETAFSEPKISSETTNSKENSENQNEIINKITKEMSNIMNNDNNDSSIGYNTVDSCDLPAILLEGNCQSKISNNAVFSEPIISAGDIVQNKIYSEAN